MFLRGLKDMYWPVGEPDSLGSIYTSHFNMELTRAGLPFPWAGPAHKHWPKPLRFVASHNFVVRGSAGRVQSRREPSPRNLVLT